MMRKNFCFVRFDTVEDATKVMKVFHGKEVLDRVLSIEYGMTQISNSSLSSTEGMNNFNLTLTPTLT
jgi:RNA recognition motif-containing protein